MGKKLLQKYFQLKPVYIKTLKSKGLQCSYKTLNNGELKATRERNKSFRKTDKFEKDIHKKYPLGKVKPGYKKKRNEKIQKEARKAKRNYINEVYKRKRKVTIIEDEDR